MDLYIRFVPSGISFLEQLLGDITITTTYSPVNENYDFPIRVDERWTTTTTSYSQWSGQSDYITPFPPPETDTNTTTWVVTDTGKPRNTIGQTIDYGGCNESYEMTSINSDGVSEVIVGIAPKCAIMSVYTADDIGLMIDFNLGNTRRYGLSLTRIRVRSECLMWSSMYITALNSPMEVWSTPHLLV